MQNKKQVKHRYHCLSNTPSQKEKEDWKNIFLYREVRSEAIRILLPVSTFLAEEKLATFKSCLELGLRKKFKGTPGHLLIREQHDPVLGENAGVKRRFLIIYDAVPGGTGYLKELVKSKNFMEVLELAFHALKSCQCRTTEADGCYRCVYAYQNQFSLELISRELGIQLLEQILSTRETLAPVSTLADINIDPLYESELEHIFMQKLAAFAGEREDIKWEQFIYEGKPCYKVIFGQDKGTRGWVLEPQVELGPDQGVEVYCKPDFVFKPLKHEPGVQPVAVFTDGFKYHVCPGDIPGGIPEDIRKRDAIRRSGEYWVWTLTWQDVEDFAVEASEDNLEKSDLLEKKQKESFNLLLSRLKTNLLGELWRYNKVAQLLAYLREPKMLPWGKYSAALAVSCLDLKRPAVIPDLLAQLDGRVQNSIELPSFDMPDGAVQEGGHLYGINHCVGGLKGLISIFHCEKAAISKMDSTKIYGIIRLEDGPVEREGENFNRTWNEFWRMFNLFQFLPEVSFASREKIEQYGTAEVDLTGAVAVGPVTDGEVPGGITELEQFTAAECRGVIRYCYKNSLPLPEPGYELVDDRNMVAGVCELAWPDEKVAVMLPEQEEYRLAFEKSGWSCLRQEDNAGDGLCQELSGLLGRGINNG